MSATPGWMRPLGSTGLSVSAVCAGGAPLGSMPRVFGYDTPADRAAATVRAVLDSEIRFVDTSNGYSAGESERRIGAGLAAYQDEHGSLPGDLVVATKVDPEGRDYSADRVRRSVDESRERLGLNVLPLVHLHDPENFPFEELAAPGGAFEALVALRESGDVASIGLAGGRVQEMSRYLDLGVFDVLLVHNRWTLVDRSARGLLATAVERGLGVLNAAVYGGGILAQDPRPSAAGRYGYRDAPSAVLGSVAAMRDVCARYGTDLATAALQFSLRDPHITSTVVGISRPERVAQTLDAARAVLPEALWDELAALLPAEEHWLDAPFGATGP